MYIDQARCSGCGACLESCLYGALRLFNGKAQIDATLCAECLACLPACSNGAIMAIRPALAPETGLVQAPTPLPSAHSAMHPTVAQQALEPNRLVAMAAGSALAYLGRELAPRVASAILESILRHTDQATPSSPTRSIWTGRQRRLRRHAGGVGCRRRA